MLDGEDIFYWLFLKVLLKMKKFIFCTKVSTMWFLSCPAGAVIRSEQNFTNKLVKMELLMVFTLTVSSSSFFLLSLMQM